MEMEQSSEQFQIGISVGKRISRARKAQHLTRSELAGGIFSERYISEIERGEIRPSLRALEILAQRLGLSLKDLLSSQPEKAPERESLNPESTLRIRINEEPLTPHNLTTIISSLTELSTKFWLITQDRLDELIEYSQTHDARYIEEAGLVITKITYNSPLDITFGSPNFDPKNIADALVTTIDGISQRKARLEKMQLENQAQKQAIKLAEQKAEQVQHTVALEHERQALEVERQRLNLLEQQLDLQKKGLAYALELAKKTVDLLQPNADDTTKGMIIQTLLPNILQLQNGKGLTLALPEPNKET